MRQVGNQRNCRILTLKKHLGKEERKKEEEYRIQSRLDREAINNAFVALVLLVKEAIILTFSVNPGSIVLYPIIYILTKFQHLVFLFMGARSYNQQILQNLFYKKSLVPNRSFVLLENTFFMFSLEILSSRMNNSFLYSIH